MEKRTTNISNKKSNKVLIKSPKRLLMSVSIIILFIIVMIILILSNKKVDLSDVDDYSKLNSKKYSEELLDRYQSKESKEKFLEDYDLVQGAVGIYIINNSTTDSNSFSQIIESLKKELKKDDWSGLDIDKPTFWNGNFDVTEEGIVTFKFSSKNIEPSWINDEELNNKIVFNN